MLRAVRAWRYLRVLVYIFHTSLSVTFLKRPEVKPPFGA